MKTCSAALLQVLPLFSIVAAVNLRQIPLESAGAAVQTETLKLTPQEYKLTLSNYKGVQYFAPITLNDQVMQAVYDTGSFEIMAMSKACTACKIPPTLIKYDNTSTTFVKGPGPMVNHHFAGGLVVGRKDAETVHIGDASKSFNIQGMPFWQIFHTKMAVWLGNKARFNAIVGLGHRTSAPGAADQATILERTTTNRFAVCLQKGAANPGYIYFNPASTATFTATSGSGIYRRLPVIGSNHWAVKMNEASTPTAKACVAPQACIAIIDSGTSLIGVPPIAVPMVMGLVKIIKQDCSNIDQLPNLVFNLGGHNFALPGSAYVIRFKISDTVTKCLPAFTDFKMSSAQGAIWILGMPFLRHFYTVFDRTQPAIYVADQGANCEPVAQNSTANFFNKPHQEPAFADTSEAVLPSWAMANSLTGVMEI